MNSCFPVRPSLSLEPALLGICSLIFSELSEVDFPKKILFCPKMVKKSPKRAQNVFFYFS